MSEVGGSAHPGAEAIVPWTFSGGEDRSLPAHQLPDGVCSGLRNLYYPRESRNPRTRPPAVAFSASALPGAPTGMHVYQKSSTLSYTIVSCLNAGGNDQELYYIDPSSFEPVQIAASLGSATERPSFLTFAGRLLIAVRGQYIREWSGETGTTPTPAKATGTFTVTGYATIAAGTTLVFGAQTWTFRATRIQPFEITIGASNDAQAVLIRDALNQDQQLGIATVGAGGSSNVVTVTAVRTGSAANSLATSTTATGVSAGAATMSGGVTGLALDTINTYQAPKPAMIASDKNLRVIAAGDTTTGQEDWLQFSIPADATWWARTPNGDGKYFPIGFQEGNFFSAISPFLDEIMVHKAGQNKEIYRVQVVDPDSSTWTIQRRFFSGASAALNHRCAVSLAGVHLALDFAWFRTFNGTDAYDEIASGIDGSKIYDRLAGALNPSAFLAVNPDELYVMVFPASGNLAAIYHYGSRRWSHWQFAVEVAAAVYHEGLGLMLVAGTDGQVYQLDPSSGLATDAGESYASVIEARAVDGGFRQLLVKQTLLDFESLVSGTGTLEVVVNRQENDPKTLLEFQTVDAGDLLYNATGYLYDADEKFTGEASSRRMTDQQARGGLIAPKITLHSGRAVFVGLTHKIANFGRSPQ